MRLLFLLAAGYLVLTKLVFARAAVVDADVARRLGAATAYILLLFIGYRLSMSTPPRSRVRVARTGVLAVMAGGLVFPPVGFALLVVPYLLRRSALATEREERERLGGAARLPKQRAIRKKSPKPAEYSSEKQNAPHSTRVPPWPSEPPVSERLLPALTGPSEWFEVRVDAPELAIETADGGRLEIEPGELCVRLRTKQIDGGEVTFLEVSLELADHRGSVWRSTTVLRADVIIDAIDSDDPPDEREAPLDEQVGSRRRRPQLVPLGDAPEAWRTALSDAPLGRNLLGLLDSRFYTNLQIGDRTHVVQMKYQGPRCDVGWLDARTLVASVRELIETVNREGQKREFLPVPPFALTCPSSVLVWFIAQDEHARDVKAYYGELVSVDPPEVSLLPGEMAAPQPRVVHRATN